MLDILKIGIMSSVQRSELTVCTVAFPDYCKDDVNAKKKEGKKVQIITAVSILINDLHYNKYKCNVIHVLE